MKYTSKPYSITKQEADKLRHRAEELGNCFPTQKQVLISLVSNRIPKKNTYYNSLITSNIIINKLFDEWIIFGYNWLIIATFSQKKGAQWNQASPPVINECFDFRFFEYIRVRFFKNFPFFLVKIIFIVNNNRYVFCFKKIN